MEHPNSNDFLSVPIKPESLAAAFVAAGIGTWSITLGDKPIVVWDDCCKKLFGITKGNNLPYQEAIHYIHEDDRQKVKEAVNWALDPQSDGLYDIRYRTVGADDGILRMVRFVGKVLFNIQQIAESFSGIAIDVSSEMAFEEEQQKTRVLVDNCPDFMGMSNNDNVIIGLNKAALTMLGIDASTDISTLKSADFYPEEQVPLMQEIYETLQRKKSWKGNVFLKHFKTGELIPGFGSYETVVSPETGRIIAKSVTIRDLRPELLAQKVLRDSEAMFRNVTQNAPTGLWMSDPAGSLIYVNKTLVEWTGMSFDALLGAGWANAIIEEDRKRSIAIFLDAVQHKTHYDVEFRITKADGTVCWCRAAGDPYEDEHGQFAGYVGYCLDIHQRVAMAFAIQESEERTRNIVDQSPVAIGVLRGTDFVVESANASMLKIWGKDSSIIGLPLLKALPEIEGQGFIELLEDVSLTGNPFNGYGTLAKLQHKGKLEDMYFDFVYAPLRDADRAINGILVLASEVTKQVLAQQDIAASEAKFRGLIEEAPIPTAVLVDRTLVIDVANEAMLKIWGKDDPIIGQPLAQALPELEGQPFLEILDNIFTTGKSFEANEAKTELVVDGKPTVYYVNYAYKPLFDNEGQVYAIINMAQDVTQQVLNKQKIMEAEAQLRSAIETAQLGTWEVHLLTGKLDASPRLRSWFGFDADQQVSFQNILDAIPEHENLSLAGKEAMEGKNDHILDIEHTIINQKTGRSYTIHSQGRTFFNDQGIPYLIIGSSRDITIQKKYETELERLVQERTEELQATNEELATTNEELGEANENLYRSNEELGQYAYIASHDLQEPLRKIMVFSGMLSKQQGLAEGHRPIIEKISQSSQRMSLLIKDLLEFSRLTRPDTLDLSVDLNHLMAEIVTDFELMISEKKAVIKIEPLPVINAVTLQMNQLFYNLLSNALKFTAVNRIPEITISSTVLTLDEVKLYIVKPHMKETYHRITFTDNGIGFDQKYADQIFEVFKRLHGKDIYPGSGIGLALCRRIVTNHGGYLYTTSQLDVGTSFYVVIPVGTTLS